MRIFIAGATGTLGRPLARALASAGHDVWGLTRTSGKRALLEDIGVHPLVGDALDAASLERAVSAAAPDTVVHLLTAIPPAGALRARDLRATNVLRIEGTRNLMRAAMTSGARRIVAESFIGVYGTPAIDHQWTESDLLPPIRRGPLAEAVTAMRSLEEQMAVARCSGAIETVTLRFGLFYGEGVPSSERMAALLKRRRVFIPNGATGIASFIHIDDAVSAVETVIRNRRPGPLYNVVDDHPMPLADYLKLAAAAAGAPAPPSVPAWIVRLAAPIIATAAFAKLSVANALARWDLSWVPRYPSVREGLRIAPRASSEAA